MTILEMPVSEKQITIGQFEEILKSPDDSIRQLREKAEFYLENGVAMVWLVYPEQRMVEVYTVDGEVEILLEGDVVAGGDVLPGFTMPVAEIFDDPLAA